MKEIYMKAIRDFRFLIKTNKSSLVIDAATVKRELDINNRTLRQLRNDGLLGFIRTGGTIVYPIILVQEYLNFRYCMCNNIEYEPFMDLDEKGSKIPVCRI